MPWVLVLWERELKAFSVPFLHPIPNFIGLLSCPLLAIFLSRLKSPSTQTPQPFVAGKVLQPPNHLGCLLLYYSNSAISLRHHMRMQYCKRGCTITLYKDITTLAFSAFPNKPVQWVCLFTACAHWVNIFIKLSTTTTTFLFVLVSDSSKPIRICLNLGSFCSNKLHLQCCCPLTQTEILL